MSADAPDVSDPLGHLLGRYSTGPKHLAEPAPDDAALRVMARAALRAPDHAQLVPFRFALIRGDARERLADLFERIAIDGGKHVDEAAIDRDRALRPPLTVAVVARIDQGHPQVPAHEQWIAVGAALASFLNAAHALGYGGKMLSGAKARAPAAIEAFCKPGETLVGWIALGTPLRKPGSSRREKAEPGDVLGDWPAA